MRTVHCLLKAKGPGLYTCFNLCRCNALIARSVHLTMRKRVNIRIPERIYDGQPGKRWLPKTEYCKTTANSAICSVNWQAFGQANLATTRQHLKPCTSPLCKNWYTRMVLPDAPKQTFSARSKLSFFTFPQENRKTLQVTMTFTLFLTPAPTQK